MNALASILAKAATTLVAFVCGILTVRVITGDAGEASYALFGALTALPSLVTFSDLGAGAALVGSVASSDDPRRDTRVRDQLTSVERILCAFAGIVLIAGIVMRLTGGWRLLLGSAGDLPGAEDAALVCCALYAATVPLGVWTRLLLGARRNHIVILVQGLVSPLTLLLVWAWTHFRGDAAFLAVGSFVAALTAAGVGFLVTALSLRPLMGMALRRVSRPRRYPGARVMDIGWPMLAQLISPPLAMAAQRYAVAQQGTVTRLAEYNAAAQVFFALIGLISAAGVALWPFWARARARGELRRGPGLLSVAFGGGTAAASLCIALIGPWLFGFATHGVFEVGLGTILAFGAMATCQAVLYPLGMFLMDPAGIRFQVVPTLAMAVLSLIGAVLLVPILGAAGPPLANAAAVLVCQIVPYAIAIHRHRDRLMPAGGNGEAE